MSRTSKQIVVVVIAVLLVAAGAWAWNNQTRSNKGNMNTKEAPKTLEESTESATDAGTTAKTVEVTMEAGNYYFAPKTITAKQGDTIKITLTGKGMMHNFVIDELGVKSSSVQPGNSTTITFTASKKGTFTYYCSIGSHRQLGQEGTLTIE